MAVMQNFSWHVGEDLLYTFTATSITAISGWHFSFVVYNALEDELLIKLSTDGSIVITDATNGVFTVTLTSAELADLEMEGKFVQVRRIDIGFNTVLAEGPLAISP